MLLLRCNVTVVIFICIRFTNGSGNILLGKPSTDGKAIDGTDVCSDPGKSFWQADLQGYFNISSISIKTCWGFWGNYAASTSIELYFTDPAKCPGAVSVKYGSTPSVTESNKTYSFSRRTPFPVRYLRMSAGMNKKLSLADVTAFGSTYQQKQDFSLATFRNAENKQVLRGSSTMTTPTTNQCAVICRLSDSCLAFSFKENMTDNCIVSDCSSTANARNWKTLVVDIVATSKMNRP